MTVSVEFRNPFVTRPILGVQVAVSSYDEVVRHCLVWVRQQRSYALFFAAVHMIMEVVDHPDFLLQLNNSGTVFPDGMPLVWALHLLGAKEAQQVCGPDFTLAMLAAAEEAKVSVGFYGGSESTLGALVSIVHRLHPALNVAYFESPPFRDITPEEDAAIVDRITSSGVQLLFVGLGCPKQERWIMEHMGRVPTVMFAVGAAFDFIAGNKRRAPRWMSRIGLEWLFRIACEPRRLFKRHLKHDPRFLFKFLKQLVTGPS